ncbi:phage tail protein, partial [Pectobacterium versatile]|nr:phage tail protein [Pectobacterium versatile]
RLRNITRKAQTTASGIVSGTGEPGATADAGRTINRGSLSYTTTQAITVGSDGKFSVAAVPVVAGASGNATAAVTGTFTSTPPGFDSAVTIGV